MRSHGGSGGGPCNLHGGSAMTMATLLMVQACRTTGALSLVRARMVYSWYFFPCSGGKRSQRQARSRSGSTLRRTLPGWLRTWLSMLRAYVNLVRIYLLRSCFSGISVRFQMLTLQCPPPRRRSTESNLFTRCILHSSEVGRPLLRLMCVASSYSNGYDPLCSLVCDKTWPTKCAYRT